MARRAAYRAGMVVFVTLLVRGAPEGAQTGTLQVAIDCSVALDKDKVECLVTLDGDGTEPKHSNGKEWDFWLENSGKALFLSPQNGTKFAKAQTTDGGKVACQAAAYKPDRLRIDTLPQGSHVCVLTGRRRHAELTLENIAKSGPSSIRYILWE